MFREQKWELVYGVKTESGEDIRSCRINGEDRKARNLEICKERGYRVVSCKKLYPFSTERNQHNFMLISNICSNRMHDMLMGDLEYNEVEFSRLAELKDKADEFFCLPLPVAWMTWEKHEEAKELAMMAINHRMNVCIEHGRPDLVQYC